MIPKFEDKKISFLISQFINSYLWLNASNSKNELDKLLIN